MKYSSFITLSLAMLLVAGCSSTPTKVNTGTIRATTFSFVDRGPNPPALEANWVQLHTVIQGAITQNLAGKGLSQLKTGGEIVVAYMVVVGNGAVTTANTDYFGSGRDTWALRDKAHDAYTASKNPNYFEAGTLLIDLIDAKTGKVLVRNYAVRPILRDITASVQANRIQEGVDEVLKGVQIAR